MTIDEAIKHAEEVAEEQKKLYRLCPVTDYGCKGDKHCKSMNYEYDGCLKCAKEHRQLAEWLKELKAYKKQSEDAINRQTVLELVVANHTELNGLNVVMYSPLYKDIKQLPPVTPQPKTEWISVSERLPKKDESVLLTICANSSLYGFNENFVKVMCGSYSPCEDKRDWIVNEIRYYIDNVIAWMPLPAPFEPQESEG